MPMGRGAAGRKVGPARWRLGLAPLALAAAVLLAGPAAAQEARYLRVGTGLPGESHFPVGGLIAGAISNPPGSPACGRAKSCGVPGLIAIASATSGSVANVAAIAAGHLEAALVQADIPMWAAEGAPPFDEHPIRSLRAVANLYPEELHLVARREIVLATPRDLKGKRVSLGEQGSGTLVHARRVLAAWGLKEGDLKLRFLSSAVAAEALRTGSLDAFFVVDAAPVPSVAELARSRPIRLIPLTGRGADKLRRGDRLLAPATIAGGTYEGIGDDVLTLQVGVSLVVAADLPDDLVYGITRTLWQGSTLRTLVDGAPQPGGKIILARALADLGVPLHPGAQRFYDELGMGR